MTRAGGRWTRLLPVVVAVGLVGAGGSRDVEVSAIYAPSPAPGKQATIDVWLEPVSDAFVVNAEPAPRLALDPTQKVLDVRQPKEPDQRESGDSETPHYRDPKQPVRFPVALAAGASSGMHLLSGEVTFFYCSKAAGWCRKGKEKVELAVKIE